MKTMKKTILSLLSIGTLYSLMLISACKKEAGPTGQAGKDGTANVKVFLFTDDTLSNGISVKHTLPITKGEADSSLFLFYYTTTYNSTATENSWYSSPGVGVSAAYQTRTYVKSSPTAVIATIVILDTDGNSYSGATEYLPKVKIVVMKPSAFMSGKKEAVDFSDYKATMQYLGLPE